MVVDVHEEGHFRNSWPTLPSAPESRNHHYRTSIRTVPVWTTVSAPGRKRSCGTGRRSAPSRSFPSSARRGRAPARTRSRLLPDFLAGDKETVLFRKTRQIAERSPSSGPSSLRDFAEDRVDPGAAVERVVVVNWSSGRIAGRGDDRAPAAKNRGPAERLATAGAPRERRERSNSRARSEDLRHGNLGDGDRRQAGSFTSAGGGGRALPGSSPRHARSGRRDPSFRFAHSGENSTRREKFTSPSRPIPPAIRSSIDGERRRW